jgi:hypothetical protein
VRVPRTEIPKVITVVENRGDVEIVHTVPFGCRLPEGRTRALLRRHWASPTVYRHH